MNIQSVSGFSPARFEERLTAAQAPTPVKVAGQSGSDNAEPVKATEPSREQVVDAVDKIKQSLPASAQSLEFSIDESSQQRVVKIIDQSTRQVVRQMPSEEALEIAKALDKAIGSLLKETA